MIKVGNTKKKLLKRFKLISKFKNIIKFAKVNNGKTKIL